MNRPFPRESDLQSRNRGRSTVVASSGMVATSQPTATLTGLDMLRTGGNAIDAAIAANAVQCVTEPMSCGLGGDLFAIVWSERDKKLFGLNSSGRAPGNWNIGEAHKLGLKRIPTFGPLSWSLPGCVSGWEALRERFGSRPFGDLLQPAIKCGHDGFPVAPVTCRAWRATDFESWPTLAGPFLPGGERPEFGDIVTNPGLAAVLEQLAKNGPEWFYHGEIAERIVKFSNEQGGRFSLKDFENHAADWVEPVSSSYRGYDIWQLPPNGQGIAVLQLINILERFDIGAMEPGSAEQIHLLVEAAKLVYEDRAAYYADPAFASVPIEHLISKAYGAERTELIDRNKASTSVHPGSIPSGKDTIYLCTADSHGNMVSLIQSIYYPFGSQTVPTGLGFALQNRGAMFSLDPDHPNALMPGKRPFNTIIPGFVTRDNEPCFAFGVMGGDFQPQGQAQILMNILDYGFSPQQAGDRPRVSILEHSTPMGDKTTDGGAVALEDGIADSVRQELTGLGHKLATERKSYGGYQGIWRSSSPRLYYGGSDPRKDGCAAGY